MAARSPLEAHDDLMVRVEAGMAAFRAVELDPLERRIIELLEALPRPRGVPATCRVLSVDLEADLVAWSNGRVAPLPVAS